MCSREVDHLAVALRRRGARVRSTSTRFPRDLLLTTTQVVLHCNHADVESPIDRVRRAQRGTLTGGDSVLARAKTIDRGLAGQAWGGDRQYSSRRGSRVRVTAGRLEGRYRRRAAITTSLEYVSARLSGSTVYLPARTNPRGERRAPPRRAPTARAATILSARLRARRLTSGPLLMSSGR